MKPHPNSIQIELNVDTLHFPHLSAFLKVISTHLEPFNKLIFAESFMQVRGSRSLSWRRTGLTARHVSWRNPFAGFSPSNR